MDRRFSKRLIATLMTALAVALVLTGCGVKKPPMPPQATPPAAVGDLAYSIDNGFVSLRWSEPAVEEEASMPIFGYRVYRSMIDPDEGLCAKCPLPFVKVANVGVVDNPNKGQTVVDMGGQQLGHKEKLKTGFDYVFKVIAYGENDITADDSNMVKFSF